MAGDLSGDQLPGQGAGEEHHSPVAVASEASPPATILCGRSPLGSALNLLGAGDI